MPGHWGGGDIRQILFPFPLLKITATPGELQEPAGVKPLIAENDSVLAHCCGKIDPN
jgi:hypothetical protein